MKSASSTFACWSNRSNQRYIWEIVNYNFLIITVFNCCNFKGKTPTRWIRNYRVLQINCFVNVDKTQISFQKKNHTMYISESCDAFDEYLSCFSRKSSYFQLPLTVWIALPWRATNMPEHTSSYIFWSIRVYLEQAMCYAVNTSNVWEYDVWLVPCIAYHQQWLISVSGKENHTHINTLPTQVYTHIQRKVHRVWGGKRTHTQQWSSSSRDKTGLRFFTSVSIYLIKKRLNLWLRCF